MMLIEDASYYDLLEVRTDATPQEIREAYRRIKATYRKESAALYTLISPEESEDLQRKIEDAYRILSDPDRRRAYDQAHGHISLPQPPRPPASAEVISLDRARPIQLDGSADLLIPPTTDFGSSAVPPAPETPTGPLSPFSTETAAPAHESLGRNAETMPPPPRTPEPSHVPARAPVDAYGALLDLIHAEKEWNGRFLRHVREQKRISIEEVSSFTRINKNYIVAIEEEDFKRLPAAVFVRGFIKQLARMLKLPEDAVVAAYISRYQQFNGK